MLQVKFFIHIESMESCFAIHIYENLEDLQCSCSLSKVWIGSLITKGQIFLSFHLKSDCLCWRYLWRESMLIAVKFASFWWPLFVSILSTNVPKYYWIFNDKLNFIAWVQCCVKEQLFDFLLELYSHSGWKVSLRSNPNTKPALPRPCAQVPYLHIF